MKHGTKHGPLIVRLLAHVVVTPGPLDTPCWVSTYAGTRGYANIKDLGQVTRQCHRVAYEHFVGPISKGLHLDHLCKVTKCCNPEHLEPVTPAENVRRSRSRTMLLALANRCHKGHSLLDHAWVDPKTGQRQCRICNTERMRRRRGVDPANYRKTRAS